MRFSIALLRMLSTPLLLSCACGNLSNQDLAFLEAIPQKDQLHVVVPANGAPPACALGTADIWNSAKSTGDSINAGVDNILALVDAIRAQPPTARDTDSRTWGPFPDQNHAGVDIRVNMSRELDASGTPWRWIYQIAARRAPGDFLPIIEGEFFGAQARSGIGRLVVHFENAWTLGTAKTSPPADPNYPMRVYYDLSGDPRTVSLDLTSGAGLGLVGFDYAYAGYTDGHGRFDYAFPDPKTGCTVEVTTYFDAQGAGRDVFRLACPLGLVFGPVQQCWDRSACIVYANDPFALTPACNGIKPCLLGSATQCPSGI
jgi:hypothetical protein